MSFIAGNTDRLARLGSTLDTAITACAGSRDHRRKRRLSRRAASRYRNAPPAEVTVAPAVGQAGHATGTSSAGHFESVDAVEIRPRVSGFVQRVAFTEGAIVRRGDPLFYIDARPYEADAARAEAAARAGADTRAARSG